MGIIWIITDGFSILFELFLEALEAGAGFALELAPLFITIFFGGAVLITSCLSFLINKTTKKKYTKYIPEKVDFDFNKIDIKSFDYYDEYTD